MLGLACDPVCGLVEVPCIKRNVAGTVNAISTTQLAMAGIESAIPADEVIDSMRRIGNDMPSCLKETGEGGLAVSRTAMAVKEKMTIGGLAMKDSWR
jgi:L-serine dehydratase